MALMPVMMTAQMASGEWYTYPTYTNSVTKIVETPSGKVYFLDGTSLYSYDNNSQEMYSYSKRNLLNDNDIIDIIYNYDQNYLLVIYSNCNMDLIYDSGKSVNFSDIKDAIMMSEKTINDVAFYKNRILVATSFGLVVYDDARHYVVESGNYGHSVNSVTAAKDRIFIYLDDPRGIYTSKIDVPHYTFDTFTKVSNGPAQVHQFFFNGDDQDWWYAECNADHQLQRIRFMEGSQSFWNEKIDIANSRVDRGYRMADGKMAIIAGVHDSQTPTKILSQKVYKFTDGEAVGQPDNVPSAFVGKPFSSYKNADRLWAFSTNGVGCYDFSGNTLVSPFEPQGACNVARVAYLTPSHDGSSIFVSTLGPSHYKNIIPWGEWARDGERDNSFVNILSGTSLRNVTCTDATVVMGLSKLYIPVYGFDAIPSPAHVAQDRFDPEIYYQASYHEGVYKVKNGHQIGVYNESNSPVNRRAGTSAGWGGTFTSCVNVDRDGSLWVVTLDHPSNLGLKVLRLPAAKVQLDPKDVVKSDWEVVSRHSFGDFFRDAEIVCCKQSPMVLVLMGYHDTKLFAYNLETGEMNTWTSFTDQDGKDYAMDMTVSIAEDLDGKIWLSGFSKGVIEIADPRQLTGNNPSVRRVKVPRNDGTDYADYLMETEVVLAICHDPSNRKWLATQNSGLYLVSADGSEILEQFTVENSQIPANQVNAVCADPMSNRVYVGTNYGLSVYNSDSAPAADDYSSAYAYPNPVRPGYTGWITIAGLMDSSLVKIADAQGNVLRSGTSEGGMFMWDGCDSYGNRVKSGVYYVLASQHPEAGSQGAVACKILVVN